MREIRFAVDFEGTAIPGFLEYRNSEYSIAFVPSTEVWASAPPQELASIQLDTLQLAVSLTESRVLFPFGYCPRTSWIEDTFTVVDAPEGHLIARVDPPLTAGAATQLDRSGWGHWTFDRSNSTLAIEKSLNFSLGLSGASLVKVADGVVLGVMDGELSLVQLTIDVDD